MRTVFYTVKGGQGCSTAAVAAALTLSRTQPVDLVGSGVDHRMILGMPTRYHADEDGRNKPESSAAGWDVTLWDGDGPEQADPDRRQVIDAGNLTGRSFPESPTLCVEERILVIRNDYMAIAHAMSAPTQPTGVLLIEEPGRALTRTDVASVLGTSVPLFAVPLDTTVARAVDAGLFSHRLARPLTRALEALTIQFIPEAQEA